MLHAQLHSGSPGLGARARRSRRSKAETCVLAQSGGSQEPPGGKERSYESKEGKARSVKGPLFRGGARHSHHTRRPCQPYGLGP